MESKKINQLATEMTPTGSDLTIIGDPITGVSRKITLLQLSATIGTGADLQGVTDNGATTTNPIAIGGLTITGLATGVLKSDSGVISSVPFGAANGVATLGGDGKVPSNQLPSYVDDVVEVANFAALPAIGETGKIYITLDNNKVYRWTGSIYVEIAANNAVWGAITGTLSNQTDLQNALNTKVPYTGATGSVNLGAYSLTATGVTANSFYAQGNGTQGGYLYLKQGTTPYSTLTGSNSITADGTKYIFFSDAGSSNGKIALFELGSLTNNTNRTYTFPDASGTLALTSDLGSYLPLAGGIMTGSILLNNNISISGQLFGTSSYANMLSMSPSDKVLIDNSGRGVIFGGTIGQGTYTYTLPNATGTLALTSDIPSITGLVPYTGATANVNLGTFDLTADVITGATGSFASNGGSNTFAINHSSGSGIALNITKGGNGEGLYINKTSGSGNAATIIGTLNATTLVKNGGTSSQFLKADGSVDSSTYLTTSSASSTYLPLSGGTLTGALSGTSATFSGDLTIDTNTLYVDSTNNRVGIGTLGSSGYLLDVFGTATFGASTTIGNKVHIGSGAVPAGEAGIGIWATGSNLFSIVGLGDTTIDSRGSYLIINPNGGNVGIGTSSPSYQLQLGADSAAKPTSALWTIASDKRIKENITPYKKGLNELMQINPINYDYNGLGGFKKGKGGVGIIAQEILAVLPDSVSSIKGKLNETDEEETDILNFNGHELIYVLINSIKEQQAQIEELKAMILAK
jgi:hypothetical protein